METFLSDFEGQNYEERGRKYGKEGGSGRNWEREKKERSYFIVEGRDHFQRSFES